MAFSNLVPFQRKTLTSDHPGLRGWEEFSREVDKLFDSFFSDGFDRTVSPTSAMTGGTLGLNIDISETDSAYIIAADLPGVDRKDVTITLEDGLLTLSGQKTIESETEGKTFHRIERRYGSFKRLLQLPEDADENAVEATMKDGVLSVSIGRNKAARPETKKIAIKDVQ
jgi:HSP20 family protein